MTLVVDASVAFKWFVPEDGHDAALALFHEGEVLIAPDLLLIEVASILCKKQRVGDLSTAQVDGIAGALPSLLAEFHPMADLFRPALDIARLLDHPVYDCLYLACADVRNATLVSADQRLLGRVAGSPWGTRVLDLRTLGGLT